MREFTLEDRELYRGTVLKGVSAIRGSQMAMTGSGSHPVVDFGMSSVETLKTASGFCQFVISDIKIRKVTITPRHEE